MNDIKFEIYDESFMLNSWEWLHDQEIKQMTDSQDFTKEQQLEWFKKLKGKTDYLIYGIKYNNIRVGACGLKNITKTDGEFWGYIGEKEYWGKGIGRAMLAYIEKVAKEKKLNSVYLHVLRDNLRAQGLYAKSNYIFDSESERFYTLRKKLC